MNFFYRKPFLKIFLLFSFLFLSLPLLAAKKFIALTIDDLPFVGAGKNAHLDLILEPLIKHGIPTTGFVIAGNIRPHDWALLQKFHDSGFKIGNHTLSHANLNKLSSDDYIEQIDAADKILEPILTEPKFFRYPYLATGQGNKALEVRNYLLNKNYQVAPITIDSKDFVFNQLLMSIPDKKRASFYQHLRPAYIDYLRQQTLAAETKVRQQHGKAQILLLHANLLNSYALEDVILFYKENGYEFINLEDALPKQTQLAKTPMRKSKLKLLQKLESWVAWD